MGSRTWFKIYSDKWLDGSISKESWEVKGLFIDLLALAASGRWGDQGIIQAKEGKGFPAEAMARILGSSAKKYRGLVKTLVNSGRVSVDSHDVLIITNWVKYQSEYTRQQIYRQAKKVTTKVTKKVTPKVTDEIEIEKRKYIKEKIGEFGNVFLSKKEYQNLINRFGESNTREKIDYFSRQKEAKGYKYSSDYAAILNWDRKDVPKAKSESEELPWL